MDGRLLSICIPTYNRASRVTALVKRILECESQEFLVEITDNASTDNTVRELSSISDERVVLYRNTGCISCKKQICAFLYRQGYDLSRQNNSANRGTQECGFCLCGCYWK